MTDDAKADADVVNDEIDENKAPMQTHNWSAYYDDDGQLYYYNAVTQESSWTPPDEAYHSAEEPLPTETLQDDMEASTPMPSSSWKRSEPESNNSLSEDNTPERNKNQTIVDPVNDTIDHDHDATSTDNHSTLIASLWVAYTDDEGREYYYNTDTGETQWEKPDDATQQPTTPAIKTGHGEPINDSQRVETPPHPSPDMEVEPEPERVPTPELEIDPKVKRLQDSETALNLPDSILELGCLENVNVLLEELGGSEGGQKAMQSLVNNFHGQTAICGLLGQWLAEIKEPDKTQIEDTVQVAADEIRQSVQETIYKIAKEKFNQTVGDNIFQLKKTEAIFLDEMMESERWRKLLIDLSATNNDSTLLKFCLRSISNRGHHREIIKRINPSDHFAVFNAMLASEITVVGKMAFGASSDLDTTMGMTELVDDLKRTCTSTSYTYLYSMEVLRYLVEQAKKSSESRQMNTAIRKWERLKEDLENAMIDPSIAAATAGSSSLYRKRRLDVALTISELQQHQRRRLDPAASNEEQLDNDRHQNSLETALLNLLKKSAAGALPEDSALEQLLSGCDKSEVGKLLISYPLAMKTLLGYLFKPGSARVSSLLTRAKCAHLVALAVMAAETVSNHESGERTHTDPIELKCQEELIKGMLLTGSQMCELVENMVSFTVSSNVEENNASAGMKLCALALKSATVAQGVVTWSLEVVRGSDFLNSASYPTLSPSILGLVRIIATKHPFTRRTVMDVALTFLGHTNSEISSQKMNSLKEQSLRLLVILLCKGEVISVFGMVTSLINRQGVAVIDSSLLRYFVGGLLDVMKPPFSLVIIRAMGAMLLSKMCIEAIRSKFFGDVNQGRLKCIVTQFEVGIENGESVKATVSDKKLVSLLVSVYC